MRDSAAGAGQIGRFETEWLVNDETFAVLADLPDRWNDSVHGRLPPKGIQTQAIPTCRDQEGTAYNDQIGWTAIIQDLERCALCSGDVQAPFPH